MLVELKSGLGCRVGRNQPREVKILNLVDSAALYIGGGVHRELAHAHYTSQKTNLIFTLLDLMMRY